MIPNGAFQRNLQVGTIVDKMREGRLRWFGHVKRRPQSTPVRKVRRGRPKLRLEDRLKTDLKELLLFEDMTSDRNSWRTRIRRPVQTLSGGQKQRVAIAGALVKECKVLLLDELTTFLDESDQLGVIKVVKNTLSSSEDVTALWVTHRLEELKYADGAVYMEDGRVVMHGEASTIINSTEARKATYTNTIRKYTNYHYKNDTNMCRFVLGLT
ncbi:ABC transporter I family member 10-like protein [Tanacetum coccineum]